MTSPGAHTSGPFSPRRGNGPAISAEEARRGIGSGNATDIGAGNGGQRSREAGGVAPEYALQKPPRRVPPEKNLFFRHKSVENLAVSNINSIFAHPK